jgi:hypothetical protein
MNWAVSNAGPATIRDSGQYRLPSKVVNDIQIHVLVVISRRRGRNPDIIRELKQLADKSGYRTLSAILGAALVEAHLQSGESEH